MLQRLRAARWLPWAVVGVLTALALLVWILIQRPSKEESTGTDLANKVSVSGFRQTARHVKSEDTVIIFVGPADSDLATRISASGISFAPPPSDLPTDDPPWRLILNGRSAQLIHGLTCRVGVRALQPGAILYDGLGLTADEMSDVQNHRMTVLEITIGCRPLLGGIRAPFV